MDLTIIFQLQQSRKKLKFQIKVHFLFPLHFTTSYACLEQSINNCRMYSHACSFFAEFEPGTNFFAMQPLHQFNQF